MDDEQEYTSRREELLQSFRDSLSRPMSDRYFDEDDLIEIFDYAGDINDDYLRMEVLLCGARFFPNSEALYQRRGIFYAQYSDDALAKFVDDAHEQPYDDGTPYGGMIFDILRVRRDYPRGDEADRQLLNIADLYDNYSDEEVIQFVDLVSYLGRFEWLKEHLGMLRAKSQYPNVLLYETAVLAENSRQPDYAATLLEELTQLEPFNPYYWTLLAKQYALLDDAEKSLSAIDYSLAINPEDAQANLVKARILYASEHGQAEVVPLLNKAISNDKLSTEAPRMLANVFNNDGHPDMAAMVLQEILNNDPTPQQIIEVVPELILLMPPNVDKLLDLFYNNNEENSQLMWASWAQQLSFFGYPELSRRVIRCYERNTGTHLPSMFSIEDAFVNKHFDATLDNIGDYIKEVGASESDFPSVAAMHLVAMVKSGALAEARQFCDFFQRNIDLSNYKTLGSRLEFMGLLKIITIVKRHLDNPFEPFDWQNFDPLDYWK